MNSCTMRLYVIIFNYDIFIFICFKGYRDSLHFLESTITNISTNFF